jgi:hypothetical protein
MPADRVAAWSPGPLPPTRGPRLTLDLLGAPTGGWPVTLEIRGAEPIALELAAFRAVRTPAVQRMVARLPRWTTVTAVAVVGTRETK